MAFKGGNEWKGNAKGRPVGSKGIDLRNSLTKQLAVDVHGDTREIIYRIIEHAKNDDIWALKLFVSSILPYFLSKPKSDVDDSDTASADRMIEKLTVIPSDTLAAIKKMLIDEIGE